MDYTTILKEMQEGINHLQRQLDQLISLDFEFIKDVYLTRQEAADFIGKSLRQLDRDCKRFRIPKEYKYGGIRIRKSELVNGMENTSNMSLKLNSGMNISDKTGQ